MSDPEHGQSGGPRRRLRSPNGRAWFFTVVLSGAMLCFFVLTQADAVRTVLAFPTVRVILWLGSISSILAMFSGYALFDRSTRRMMGVGAGYAAAMGVVSEYYSGAHSLAARASAVLVALVAVAVAAWLFFPRGRNARRDH